MAARDSLAAVLIFLTLLGTALPASEPLGLRAGFAHVDITPDVQARPVWLAGYGWGRQATGVHDPLYARCLVLDDGQRRIALVSLDLIGFALPLVQQIRQQLSTFEYVLVCSTHNHEGPDTIGLWGKQPWQRGVDDEYLELIVAKVVQGVQQASGQLRSMQAAFGTARDATLLDDRRKPYVKDDVLRVLQFTDEKTKQVSGIVVQWNCHPEALGPKNTRVTADFPAATIAALQRHYECPVVYFSGALGGLMAPPTGTIKDKSGRVLVEGDFAYAQVYGQQVAQLAETALRNAQAVTLTPLQVASCQVTVPVTNPFYRLTSLLGVLQRPVVLDGAGPPAAQPATLPRGVPAVHTEVACLRLGQVRIACIPGELYPELVYGQFQEPVQPAVDFPTAPCETPVADLMPDHRWLLFGLANDEIGYLIPKRQWDVIEPYAYGRVMPQYGEINSCGPEAGPRVMKALATCMGKLPP